jgi:tetratricopeptide (TPR) repeat protein
MQTALQASHPITCANLCCKHVLQEAQRQARAEDARKLYVQAAQLFQQLTKHNRLDTAAACYEGAKEYQLAAETYSTAGLHCKAAECFIKAAKAAKKQSSKAIQFWQAAVASYCDAGEHEKALECVTRLPTSFAPCISDCH